MTMAMTSTSSQPQLGLGNCAFRLERGRRGFRVELVSCVVNPEGRIAAVFDGELQSFKRHGLVLKRAVARTLKNFGKSNFVWSPLFGGVSGAGDNARAPRADEPKLWSQWLPVAKRRGLFFLIGSAVISLLIVSGPTTSTLAPYALQPTYALTEENLLFLEAWRAVDRAYVDKSFNGQSWFRYREDALRKEPMNTREETYAAIRKMLSTLDDPFTRFLEPEKFKSLKSGTSGALTGVGLEVGFDVSSGGTSEDLVVVSPVSGGPAGRAGILPGDVILAINGVATQGMGLYDAAQRLQGPLNSAVELTVLNKATTVPKTVTVMREKITLNPVSWKLCEIPRSDKDSIKIGYIRLSTFNSNSSRAVRTAIENLRDSGATSFVLDIRNNSGGLFPAGIEIAKMWLDKGVIVYISDSKGVRDIYETDGEGAIATTEPLTVLVNKGTASASEVLAGALKDNKRALIAGEPTFGKGRIQSIFELSDGSGMAVTVARYETPAHINIDKYCAGWVLNEEMYNIRDWPYTPPQCYSYIRKYMEEGQYMVDFDIAVDAAIEFFDSFHPVGESDAVMIDVDETLLSTQFFRSKVQDYGRNAWNPKAFDVYVLMGSSPHIPAGLRLYSKLRTAGWKLILISGRPERLREATIQNLLHAGYTEQS